MSLTPEHFLFIPSIFLLGWVVGFLMGQARHRGTGSGSGESGDGS